MIKYSQISGNTQNAPPWLEAEASCFANAFTTDGSTRRYVAELLDDIQNGAHRKPVESLRQALADGHRDVYTSQKRVLYCATPAGTFTERGIEGFEKPSELAPFDLDFDEKRPELLPKAEDLRDRLAKDPIVAAVFVSPSGAGVKPWVLIPRVSNDTEYKQIFAGVAKYLQTTYCNVATDGDASDISRLCFLSWDPGLHRNPDALPFPGYREARLLNALAQMLWKMQDGERDFTRNKVAHTLGGHIAGGLFDEAYVLKYFECIVRATSQHPDKSWKKFQKQLDRGKKRPIKDARLHVSRTAQQAAADAAQHQNGQHPARSTDLPLSDTTNAYKLVERHGENLRYCYPFKKWLVWSEARWVLDDTGQVMRWAKDTVKDLVHTIDTLDDDKAIQALFRHIKSSLATPKLKALVEGAQSELPVLPDDLDNDLWLLNCLNGTIDLRTGKLRHHQRDDFLTKLAPVVYDPASTCPTWEAFLNRIMDENTNLIRFLQKAIGYSLTGDTREQCLFLLYGVGANGKSTLIDTLLALLGDYAKQAEFTTFLQRQYDTVRNDIAALRGARFVSAVEAGDGRRFAEPLLKLVTGGDTIRARFLYQEEFEFKPQFKLFLATNHKPNIKGTDHAIWRRIRLVPFTVTIPETEQDQELPARLREELSGILTWAVEGCLAWQEEGLGIPAVVKAATDDYRNEMDIVGQFLDECCLSDPIVTAFKTWCQQSGEQELTQTAFGLRLKERGYQPEKTSGKRWWVGLGLLPETDEEAEDTVPF
jgi:putative DNA primase/helicase